VGVAQALSYDARNRLVSSGTGSSMHVAGTTSEPASVNVQGQAARMLPGNVFEADVPAGQTALTVQATDASGNTRTNTYQVTSTSGSGAYTHDANGNITGKTEAGIAWTYEWNAENQLLRVTKNGTEAARFAYDPLGRRVAKVAGEVATSYTYDGADVPREAVNDGSSTTTYRYGNLEAGANEPGYAFTGREWDPEAGLYYYRARYYDPRIGRFLSEDPIGFAGGDVNLYGYVRNQPAGWVDPHGLSSLVYYPATNTLAVQSGTGQTLNTYPAYNNVASNKTPWPAGTYGFSWWSPHQGSGPSSDVGSHGNFIFDVPPREGMGVHSGRVGKCDAQSQCGEQQRNARASPRACPPAAAQWPPCRASGGPEGRSPDIAASFLTVRLRRDG
jgi:RHS repeat-associated protein